MINITGLWFDVWSSPDVLRDAPGLWLLLGPDRVTVLDVLGTDDVRATAWEYEDAKLGAHGCPRHWHAAYYTDASVGERGLLADAMRARNDLPLRV